ncbi:MAG: hypothetical protein S4CHLAM123_14620 [Chlamydiales bacterium]|nr:hypothetical protein [Chlamydiales bacterium]
MSLWGMSLNIWIDVVAVIIAIAALIAIGIGYRKKETHGGTLGLFLVAITAGLLIVAVFYDIGKGGVPIHRFDIGPQGMGVILNSMQEQLRFKCLDPNCNQKQCLEITHLSRDWHIAECNAAATVSTALDAIRKKKLGAVRAFKEFELYRKGIIRQIETSFEAVQRESENEDDFLKLQNAISELIIFDQVVFNEVESLICSD